MLASSPRASKSRCGCTVRGSAATPTLSTYLRRETAHSWNKRRDVDELAPVRKASTCG